MTSLNLVAPDSLQTRIPLVRRKPPPRNPLSQSLQKYKKGYAGLNIFLSWTEKICKPQTASFLSSKHKVLKLHSSTLALPAWFENASKLSRDLRQVKAAKNGTERSKALRKLFFTSLKFTNSSISATRVLDSTHVIDLTKASDSLPHTLTGVSSVASLILNTNNLFQNCKKWHIPSSFKEARECIAHFNNQQAISIITGVCVVLGFFTAVMAVLYFFFSIIIPFYLMLSISTFSFFASLVTNLPD
jgi:hypothetical protein